MNLNRKTYKTTLDGEDLSLEFSELAGQANAAVIGRLGQTAVLVTAVMGKNDVSGDFFPLSVDYEERFYAAGKILGSRFIRREGKASDDAILSGRLIDRTMRPLFDPRLRREVKIVVTVLAYDEKNDPDIISLIAASAALGVSNIPWGGPVAGVKLASSEPRESDAFYTSTFAGTETQINMIELEGKEIQENLAAKLFADAQKKIGELVTFQKAIIKEIGKPKENVALPEPDQETLSFVQKFLSDKLETAMREKTLDALKDELFKQAESETGLNKALMLGIFEDYIDAFVHTEAIKKGKRPDGRKFDEVRDLYAEVGILERTHGSAIFMRGTTQILAVTTLGSPAAEQLIETIEFSGKKRFMLHYNFPSFATGEIKQSRGPGRREIGHGALALKALINMIPSKDEFPYAIRVVAETLSSNGSSSMASTCAACLSLMDAGVPIKKLVAGIAIGLMSDEREYKILTDIQGPEDHYGDMDLKIAGTRDGITAIQMDVKINGIDAKIFADGLAAAQKARFHILDVMEKTLPKYRETVSSYAPIIMKIPIPQDKIGLLIGPGGRTIKGIISDVGENVAIDIEQENGQAEGYVFVSGTDRVAVEKAFAIVKGLTREYTVGEIIEGPIVRILEFGAIVDLGGGKDGMIHVSELKEGFTKRVEDVLHIGDRVTAKVIRVDPEGKIGLSLKAMGKPAS
ncbi:MAG: polyribonucleotide nucleotidyltransferase [Candidatus Jorgensenbacteria bacterium]|nr:polyribonucleotide nucleotidyltransferase [Candidatus Jorgensenbacteria bacterium]